MASTYSTNTKLELITTGEKAGQWGGITNTNLQIVEQAATGYASIDMAGASVTLALTDGATSNGKNVYLRLYGTLAASRTLTMPNTANRVWFIDDQTDRNGTNKYTLGVLTAGGSSTTMLANKSVNLCRSDGSETKVIILKKGVYAIDNTYSIFTAVAGDQIFANTSTNILTVKLPASPTVGDEVTIIDSRDNFASNAVTVDRNGKPINNAASNATLDTDGMSATFIYVDGTCGWNYLSKAT
jgi:hypothetical protein